MLPINSAYQNTNLVGSEVNMPTGFAMLVCIILFLIILKKFFSLKVIGKKINQQEDFINNEREISMAFNKTKEQSMEQNNVEPVLTHKAVGSYPGVDGQFHIAVIAYNPQTKEAKMVESVVAGPTTEDRDYRFKIIAANENLVG